MPFYKTAFPGLLIFEPVVFKDSRGYFLESYNEKTCREEGVDIRFVQDNQAKSSYGVIRGLHYQLQPYAQTKFIRVLTGAILDVVLDLRKGSPTFGMTYSLELSAENNKQLASHAVDIIDKAIEAEDKHLEIGRRLRKEADIAFTKARTIFNARTHLIGKGEALPIALELALLNPADVGIVSEHVKTLNVPDYFAQRNKVEADKTS